MKSYNMLFSILFIIVLAASAFPALAGPGEACKKAAFYVDEGIKLYDESPANAEVVFKEAARLCPGNPNVHYDLALSSLAQDNARASYKHLKRAMELEPEREDLNALNMGLLILGGIAPQKGQSMLDSALLKDPEDELLNKVKIAVMLKDPTSLATLFEPLKADQVAMGSVKEPANDRYKVNIEDNTVVDTDTGLMWEYANDERTNLDKARKYCQNLELAGYDDWRLPTVDQMRTLVVKGKRAQQGAPVFDEAVFKGRLPRRYWVSDMPLGTSVSSEMGRAFNMEKGSSGDRVNFAKFWVWCVREN